MPLALIEAGSVILGFARRILFGGVAVAHLGSFFSSAPRGCSFPA
jgi:hypothetical protein